MNGLLEIVARNWWALVLRGIAGVIFGIITFLAPGISLEVLVLLFGAWALVDGVFDVAAAFRPSSHPQTQRWWWLLLEGLIGIAVGVLTFIWPGITAIALLYLIAFWALITGVLELGAAIHLRKVISGEWLLVLSGIASIALGILLLLFPVSGALAVVLWIGAYALVSGIVLIALGLKLRSWHKGGAPQPRVAHGTA